MTVRTVHYEDVEANQLAARLRHNTARLPKHRSSSVLGSGIVLATRKPMLLISTVGKLTLLRLDDEQVAGAAAPAAAANAASRRTRVGPFTRSKSVSSHSQTLPPWPAVP